MEILKKVKNTEHAYSSLASYLIHSLQIQLLARFLLGQQIPIYSNILKIQKTITPLLIQKAVILNFGFNIFVILYFVAQIFLKLDARPELKILTKSLLKIVKLMPYIAFVQIFNINSIVLTNLQLEYLILGLINIVIALLQILVLKLANIAYRFDDNDWLKRKNNSIICWLLILPIVLASNNLEPTYTCFLLCIRSFCQLYANFFSLENQVIRRLEYFYPFLTFSISFMYLFKMMLNLSSYDSLINASFMILSAIYSSKCITQALMIYSLRYHLAENGNLFQIQSQDRRIETLNSLERQMDQSELEKFTLFIRILVNVYMSRLRFQKHEKYNQTQSPSDINNYDIWWAVFNRSTLKHKVQCNEITCSCKRFQKLSQQNESIENELFLQNITYLMKMLFGSSGAKNYKILIIQKYFMIEFQKKPLKTYYDLVKLYKEKLHTEERLEVEDLIRETKNIFQQVFLTEKVQNQNLQIGPILQFEEKIKDMKADLAFITLTYTKFYEFFTKTYVEINPLKKQSQTLFNLKQTLNNKLELYLVKFDRNIEFLTLCLIFYKFIDQYTGKMQKIEHKSSNLIIHLSRPQFQIKDQIDIFDPFYGAVKIDLVFHPGQIIEITKNICQLLNYKSQQIIGQSVGGIMPMIFAKYHGKFLKNFIQKGALNVLKIKQRIFYAKNSQKFIVPITVRLKIDYMNINGFSACSLLNKKQTKSDFIMLNNSGKIEEVSQKIYNILFRNVFKEEIAKIKRLSLFKMLLPLNGLLNNVSEKQNAVHEGVIMTSDVDETINAFFKASQFSRYFKTEQISQENSTRSDLNTFCSRSTKFYNNAQNDKEKILLDLKESFKEFLRTIKLNQVKAYRIIFKFYQIVTSEFKCKMVQILSIKEELSQQIIETEVPLEILQVGEVYGMEKQEIQTYQNVKEQIRKSIKKRMDVFLTSSEVEPLLKRQTDNQKARINSKNFTQILGNGDNANTAQNSIAIQNSKACVHMDDNFRASEGSSVFEENEENRLKQTLMLAFDQKDFVNKNAQIAIIVLILLLALSFGLVCMLSMRLETDYKDIQLDNLVIANVRLNLEFRLAFQQVQHFYEQMDWPLPGFLATKKQVLTNGLRQILQNSIKWIHHDVSNELYSNTVSFRDFTNGFEQTRQILFTMNRIYTMFLLSQQQGNFLSDNYIQINSKLGDIQKKEKEIVLQKSLDLRVNIYIVGSVYLLLLFFLVLVFSWANSHSIEKEDQVINFLPYINPKQAIKKLSFCEKMYDYLKQKQTISVPQIENLEKLNKYRFQQKTNHQQSLHSSLSPRFQSSQNQSSHSKLFQIIKHKNKLFTFKNGLISFFLLGLCVSVVLYAEIFFSIAHEKFKAYITLKDATMIMENMPARMMFLHFSNFDNALRGAPPIEYPQDFYVMAHDQRFKLRMNLSTVQFFQSDMAKLIEKHITSNICLLTECPKNSNTTVNRQLSYLSNRLRNAFDYIRIIKSNFPNPSTARSQLDKWFKQNKVRSLIQATDSVLDLVKLSEKEITELFDNQIKSIGRSIFFISLAMIPFLIVIVTIVRRKFIEFVAQRLQVTENIYRHFSWSILSTNSYAINYFQEKIKNSKRL